jgi:hypothetical protein
VTLSPLAVVELNKSIVNDHGTLKLKGGDFAASSTEIQGEDLGGRLVIRARCADGEGSSNLSELLL